MLGPTGRNFAAGMSGRRRPTSSTSTTSRVNPELVDLSPLRPDDETVVHELLERHVRVDRVGRRGAAPRGLGRRPVGRFTLVLPRDYQRVLDVRAAAEAEGLDLDGSEVWERIMEASRG